MDAKGSFKDDEKFYLGALHGSVVCILYSPSVDTHMFVKVAQMYNITSGDPSRGTISLESDTAPPLGTKVQVRTVRSPRRHHHISDLPLLVFSPTQKHHC